MIHTSTVTSKGTITIPAGIRQKLGIKEGDKVEISAHGGVITAKLQIGWDEFFSNDFDAGQKARQQIKSGAKKSLKTNQQIAEAINSAKANKHAKH